MKETFRLLTTLSILLLTITIVGLSGCGTFLPADFPKPPVVDICAPVLTGKKGDQYRYVAYWRCQRTDSDKKRDEPTSFVQIGISVDDWNKGQNYRSEVEEFFKTHKCTKK